MRGKMIGLMLFLLIFLQGIGCSNRKERETVNEPERRPRFTNVEDLYGVRGRPMNYGQTIRAFDEWGVELTDQIRVDASAVILDECGTYPLYFTVEDAAGKIAEEMCMVHIVEGERAVRIFLQEKEEAFVRIYSKDEKEAVWGSGFIFVINEEGAYILTNAHAVRGTKADLFFADGSRQEAVILATKQEPDLAILYLNFNQEDGVREKLCAVEWDLEHWENLDPENLPAVGYRYKDEQDQLWIEETGCLLQKEERIWAFSYPLIQYSAKNKKGASGSAVMDESGKLIGMTLGTSIEEGQERHWGISLPDIVAFYEEVVGLEPKK